MADIIALPCAANERVVQMPRRGPLPARYPYLPRVRRDMRLAQSRQERDRNAPKPVDQLAAADAEVLVRIETASGAWNARVLGGPDWNAVLPALSDLVAKLEEEAGIARRAPVLALTLRQAVGGGTQ